MDYSRNTSTVDMDPHDERYNGRAWTSNAAFFRNTAATEADQPKNLFLKEMIAAAILSGDLAQGSQLPPEPVIAELSGISLGTVRRALEKLSVEGLVVRKHGRGTFVSSFKSVSDQSWYARFRNPKTGALIEFTPRLLERRLIPVSDAESVALGEEALHVHLRRLIITEDNTKMVNDIVFEDQRFALLLELPAEELEKNLRLVLAQRLQTPVLNVDKVVRLVRPQKDVAVLMGVAIDLPIIRLTAVGLTFDDRKVFNSVLWVPECEFDFDVGTPHSGD